MTAPALLGVRRPAAGIAAVLLLAGALVSVNTGTGADPAPMTAYGARQVATGDGVRVLRGSPIKLTAPRTAAFGSRMRLTGTVVVRPKRGAVKPRPVRLSERIDGTWRLAAKKLTTRTGAFAFRVAAGKTARTRTFRVDAPSFRGLRALRTGGQQVKVKASGASSPGSSPSAGDLITPEKLPAGYAAAPPANDWDFLFSGGGRWDPCQVIRWSYNDAGESYQALADVARAFAKISGVSGLDFQYAGPTSFRYLGAKSDKSFPAGTDMVVSWANQNEVPDLSGSVVGIGGASGYGAQTPGADVDVEITRGHLTLDKGNDFGLSPGFDGSGWGQVMMHEILHALGLAHASTASQLMYPTASSQNFRFGAGDIRGMTKVGDESATSGCLDGPPAR